MQKWGTFPVTSQISIILEQFVLLVSFSFWLVHRERDSFLSLAQGSFSFSQRWAEYCLPTTSYFSIFVTAQPCFTCSNCLSYFTNIYLLLQMKLPWNSEKGYSLCKKKSVVLLLSDTHCLQYFKLLFSFKLICFSAISPPSRVVLPVSVEEVSVIITSSC